MFEPAELADVDELLALRDNVARWLLDRGIEQWLPGEFTQERMRTWIEHGYVHVHRRNGTIVAAVAVLDDDPDIWSDRRDGAGYVHLLMVERAYAGHRLGDAALSHAEGQITARAGKVARLDAVSSNDAIRAWYEQRGYRPVGAKTFEEEALFDTILYEKTLS